MTSAKSPIAGIKDTGIVLATTVLTLVGTLGVQSCLAWFLAPAGRGEFALCVTFAYVVGVFFSLGTDRAIQYCAISKRLPAAQAVTLALVTAVSGSAVAVFVGWFLPESSLAFFDKADTGLFRFALALVPVLAVTTSFELLLAALKRYVYLGSVNLLTIACNLVFTLWFVGGMGMGVRGALAAIFVARILAVGIQLAGLWKRDAGSAILPRVRTVWFVLGYGLRYYPARLGNILNAQIGLILLAWIASTRAEIGFFALASVLVNRIQIIPDSLNIALLPRVGSAESGRPELVALSSRMSCLVVGACVVVLVVFAPLIVPVLFSPSFQPCVLLLWIMAPGVWIRSTAKPLTTYFLGINRPGMVSLSTTAELAANFLLLPLLYNTFGLPGAAAAATVGQAAGSLVLIVAFRAVSGRTFRQSWLWQEADTNLLRDLARPLLGRKRETPGHFTSLEEADDCWPSKAARQVIVLADRVIKRQRPELMRVELEKHRRGIEIGSGSGQFYVPRILQCDLAAGVAEFERVGDVVPLFEVLTRPGNHDPLLIRAAQSLSAIHDGLTLPESSAVSVPRPWLAPNGAPTVFLHGDFDAFNLLVGQQTGELVVVDWMVSNRVNALDSLGRGTCSTVGPCYFDLAWFIAALFYRRHFGLQRVRDVSGKASVFLKTYFASARNPGTMPGLWSYFRSVYSAYRSSDPNLLDGKRTELLSVCGTHLAFRAFRAFIHTPPEILR